LGALKWDIIEYLPVESIEHIYTPRSNGAEKKRPQSAKKSPNDPDLYKKDLETVQDELKEAREKVANLLKEKGAMSVKIQGGRYFVP
jgi:DNA-directed RNA polymerase delta subunit